MYNVPKDEENKDNDLEDSFTKMNQRMKLKETAYSVLVKVWPEHGEIQGKEPILKTASL